MNKRLINFVTGILLIIIGFICGLIMDEYFEKGSNIKGSIGYALAVLNLAKGINLIVKSILS